MSHHLRPTLLVRAAFVTLGLVLTIAACGIGLDPHQDGAAATSGSGGSLTQVAGVADLPPARIRSLQAAAMYSRQANAGPAYDLVPVEVEDAGAADAVLAEAKNPAQGATLVAHPWGPRLVLSPSEDVAFEALGLGREDVYEDWGRTGEHTLRDNEIRYERRGVSEWYLNGPLGLEQGFDVADRPAGRGDLVLRVAVHGALHPELQGDHVALNDASGTTRMRYGHLFVSDAQGAEVPSYLSVEGSTILIGIDDDEAVYPLTIDPLVWTYVNQYNASGTPAAGDFFGFSVALSGDGSTAVVGAYQDDDDGQDSGTAFVYRANGDSWLFEQQLRPTDAEAGIWFGWEASLSDDGNLALVSARYDNDNGLFSGSAYVFVRDANDDWTQQDKLLASDGATDDRFAYSVSLSADGTTALIGAIHDDSLRGAAYIFEESGGSWSETAKLIAGTAGDQLGTAASLSADGTVALVGAYLADQTGQDSGVAYVFVDNGTSWQLQDTLEATGMAPGDEFGWTASLSHDGTRALVGAPKHNRNGSAANADSGAAYLFVEAGGMWSQEAELIPSDFEAGDFFGYSVSLAGDGQTALVGAQGEDGSGSANDLGAAYVFTNPGGGWAQSGKLTDPGGSINDQFGWSVALPFDGQKAIVGTPYGDSVDGLTLDVGAFFAFTLRSGLGDSCTLGGTCASGICVDGVCCDTSCDGVCEACTAALTGGVDGTCAPVTAGTSCGDPTNGECTAPDTCDGAGTCLANHAAAGTACGDQGVTCVVNDACDGNGACTDNGFEPGSTICRAAADACDAPETCTGSSAGCPADQVASAVTVCRSSVDNCDLPELCDGVSIACPADMVASDGAPGSPACTPYLCGGSGTACESTCFDDGDCVGTHYCSNNACQVKLSQGALCQASNECASGFCADGFCCNSACGGGTNDCQSCALAANGVANGTCAPSLPNTACRPSEGACDPAETCDGTSTQCPVDVVAPEGEVCRPLGGGCDVAETCDGESKACPADVFVDEGTVCRDAVDVCDRAEACTGSDPACPADGVQPDTTVCRSSVGACDAAETCDGEGTACPGDLLRDASTVCRPSSSPCDVLEQCDGISSECPADIVLDEGPGCEPAAPPVNVNKCNCHLVGGPVDDTGWPLGVSSMLLGLVGLRRRRRRSALDG